ncbi:hypothetical protein QQ045_033012 [Rhodiola kirilowii]
MLSANSISQSMSVAEPKAQTVKILLHAIGSIAVKFTYDPWSDAVYTICRLWMFPLSSLSSAEKKILSEKAGSKTEVMFLDFYVEATIAKE